MSHPATERRRSPRYLCSQLVEIGIDGRITTALLEDLSLEGAAVSVEAPVEADTAIEFVVPGLTVRAKVRYCRRRETDFQVGLEFAEGCRWRPAEWKPEHLLI